MEIWKDIEGYTDYKISNLGNVKSYKFGKEKTMSRQKFRYEAVMLSVKGKSAPILIHRLIAIAFIPNPYNKPMVNHIDGNKLNNVIQNLEWCTNSENQKHAYKTGLQKHQKGSDSHRFGIISPRAKKIIHTQTGKIYDSIAIASKELGLSHNVIYRQVAGMRINKLGFTYL